MVVLGGLAMQVEVELEVVAEEDGVGVEVGDGVEGFEWEGALKIDGHLDGLLDVY